MQAETIEEMERNLKEDYEQSILNLYLLKDIFDILKEYGYDMKIIKSSGTVLIEILGRTEDAVVKFDKEKYLVIGKFKSDKQHGPPYKSGRKFVEVNDQAPKKVLELLKKSAVQP